MRAADHAPCDAEEEKSSGPRHLDRGIELHLPLRPGSFGLLGAPGVLAVHTSSSATSMRRLRDFANTTSGNRPTRRLARIAHGHGKAASREHLRFARAEPRRVALRRRLAESRRRRLRYALRSLRN